MKTLDVMTHANWTWGGVAGYARYEFSESFVDENGVEYGEGPNSYLEVATTIAGNVVTIPAYPNFPETEAAIINNGVTVTCWLLDSNRKKRTTLFEDVRIYTSLPATISLAQLVLADGASRLLRDSDVWTKEQVIDYINTLPPANKMTTATHGIARLSVAAANIADPIVVGTNDPRLSAQGIVVSTLATGGTGTEADPYTGWDTAIAAAGWKSNATYIFDGGTSGTPKVFSYSNPIVILDTNSTRLVGGGWRSTRLKFTGTGKALTFKGTTTVFRNSIEQIEIDGNANCTEGLYTESSHHMRVVNVNVRNCTVAGFRVKFGILNYYENIRCSQVADLAAGFTVVPLLGLYTEARGGGETFQACTIVNPIFEVLLGDGMEFNSAWQVEVIGGSSEQNVGRGVLVNNTCRNVRFHGMDCEGNGSDDWTIHAPYCELAGVLSAGTIRIKTGAQMTRIIGGQINSLITEAVTSGHIESLTYNIGGTGTLSFGDPDGWNLIGPIHNHSGAATGGGQTFSSLGSMQIGFPLGTNEPAFDVVNQAVINLGGAGAIHAEKATGAPALQFTNNAYFDGTNWRYRVTGLRASNVYQLGGEVYFRTAAVGTAGNVVTWTNAGKFGTDGLFYFNDGGTLKATNLGAADSGGVGFKMVRVAN